MARTFIVLSLNDSLGRPSDFRIRVTPGLTPAQYLTFATDLVPLLIGAGLPSVAGFQSSRVEIYLSETPVSPIAFCDIRDNWALEASPADGDPFNTGIPARNLDPALIAAGSQILADFAVTAWSDLLEFLQAGPVKQITPEDGDDVNAYNQAIANVRARVRPRQGARR
jgi:hypothetical protein